MSRRRTRLRRPTMWDERQPRMSPHVGPKPRTTYDAFLLRSAADPSGRWGPLGHWGPRDTAKALGKGIRIISHACGISSLCSDSRSCHRVLTTAPIRARRPRGRPRTPPLLSRCRSDGDGAGTSASDPASQRLRHATDSVSVPQPGYVALAWHRPPRQPPGAEPATCRAAVQQASRWAAGLGTP